MQPLLTLPNQKITPAQRERLLCVYLSGDRTRAEALAATFGVNKRYAAKLASDRGFKPMFVSTASSRPRRDPHEAALLTEADISTIERAQIVTAAFFDVPHHFVVSSRRGPAADRARGVAMFVAWRLTSQSYPQIARMFSGCGHDTILRACQRIKERMATDPQLASDIEAIEREVMR